MIKKILFRSSLLSTCQKYKVYVHVALVICGEVSATHIARVIRGGIFFPNLSVNIWRYSLVAAKISSHVDIISLPTNSRTNNKLPPTRTHRLVRNIRREKNHRFRRIVYPNLEYIKNSPYMRHTELANTSIFIVCPLPVSTGFLNDRERRPGRKFTPMILISGSNLSPSRQRHVADKSTHTDENSFQFVIGRCWCSIFYKLPSDQKIFTNGENGTAETIFPSSSCDDWIKHVRSQLQKKLIHYYEPRPRCIVDIGAYGTSAYSFFTCIRALLSGTSHRPENNFRNLCILVSYRR